MILPAYNSSQSLVQVSLQIYRHITRSADAFRVECRVFADVLVGPGVHLRAEETVVCLIGIAFQRHLLIPIYQTPAKSCSDFRQQTYTCYNRNLSSLLSLSLGLVKQHPKHCLFHRGSPRQLTDSVCIPYWSNRKVHSLLYQYYAY